MSNEPISAAPNSASLYDASNPLMNPPALPHHVPPLDLVKNEHFIPAFQWAMDKDMENFIAVRDNPEPPTFENTIEARANGGGQLTFVSGVFNCFTASNTNDELRQIELTLAPERTKH